MNWSIKQNINSLNIKSSTLMILMCLFFLGINLNGQQPTKVISEAKSEMKAETNRATIQTSNDTLILPETERNDTLKIDSLIQIISSDTTETVLDTLVSSTSDSLSIIKKKPKIVRPWHLIKDSLDVHYILEHNSELKKIAEQTISPDFHEEDLIRKNKNHYFHTGNVGSSAKRFKYQLDDRIDRNIGFHQYDLYNPETDSFRHYIVLKPYSQAYFSTGGIKNNFSNGIKFANTYAGDTHFTIDFKRINSEGIYSNQVTKHSDLNIGLFWNNNRHQLFIHQNNRTNTEVNSGGVYLGQYLTSDDLKETIAMQLNDAHTRHYQSSTTITNKYSLYHKKDYEAVVYHQLAYVHKTYKYSDVDVEYDSSYYGLFINDNRGIRFLLQQNQWNNSVGTDIKLTNNFKINTKLRHQYHLIENDFHTPNSHLVDLIADAEFALGRWEMNGNFQFNIIGLENNSYLNLESKIGFGKRWGSLSFQYQNVRRSASYIQNKLILNNQFIWDQSFDIQFSNSLNAKYHNDYTNTTINAQTAIINNHIYLDTTMAFKQEKSALTIQQLSLTQGFKIRNIHSRHELLLQQSSNTIFALPDIYIKHDLYWKYTLKSSDKIIMAGANFTYFQSDNILNYQPILGEFYATSNKFYNYWTSNVYASMKISSFRFYVQYQNLEQQFDNRVDYQVLNNPQSDSIFLFGINWVLFD